jgi:hypothetical protein
VLENLSFHVAKVRNGAFCAILSFILSVLLGFMSFSFKTPLPRLCHEPVYGLGVIALDEPCHHYEDAVLQQEIQQRHLVHSSHGEQGFEQVIDHNLQEVDLKADFGQSGQWFEAQYLGNLPHVAACQHKGH